MTDVATMPAPKTVLRAGPSRIEIIRRRMRGKTAFKIGLAMVALGSVIVASLFGVPLGLIAGFLGGKLDSVIMRVLDAILAFPVILLAILVVASLGTQTINLVLTIGFVFIPYFTRLVRGNVLVLKEREFVEASRASGASDPYLIWKVILPNILSPVVVQASLTMSLAVLIEAGLSYLGL